MACWGVYCEGTLAGRTVAGARVFLPAALCFSAGALGARPRIPFLNHEDEDEDEHGNLAKTRSAAGNRPRSALRRRLVKDNVLAFSIAASQMSRACCGRGKCQSCVNRPARLRDSLGEVYSARGRVVSVVPLPIRSGLTVLWGRMERVRRFAVEINRVSRI